MLVTLIFLRYNIKLPGMVFVPSVWERRWDGMGLQMRSFFILFAGVFFTTSMFLLSIIARLKIAILEKLRGKLTEAPYAKLTVIYLLKL